MPSRRQLLASICAATAVGIAGCSGSDTGGSGTTDCHGHALAHGDGDVLDGGAMATVEGDDVRLVVPLSVETVERQNVGRLVISATTGAERHLIPVSPEDRDVMANKPGVSDGQLRYEQYLGHRPFHGRYDVVAVTRDDERVDSITVEFNCFPDVDE